MQARTLIRVIVAVLCIGITVIGLNNVYGDNAAVVAEAQRTACAKPGCSYTTLRQERSAITQSFTFQTQLAEKGARARSWSVDVECKREYLLLGAHKCTALNAPPSSVSVQ